MYILVLTMFSNTTVAVKKLHALRATEGLQPPPSSVLQGSK